MKQRGKNNWSPIPIIILTENVQNQIFLRTFPVSVPNTVDNDKNFIYQYLTRVESYHQKHEKKT